MSTKEERAVPADPGSAVVHSTDVRTAHVGVLGRRRFATVVASAVSFLAAVGILAGLSGPAVAFPTGPLLNEQLILRVPPAVTPGMFVRATRRRDRSACASRPAPECL